MKPGPLVKAAALSARHRKFFRANDPRVRAATSSVAAALALIAFDSFRQLTASAPNPLVTYAFSIVVAIGLFQFLHIVFSEIIQRVADSFTARTSVRGSWFHILQFEADGRTLVRNGPVEIKDNQAGELIVNGLNFDALGQDNYHSSWGSLVCGLLDTRMYLIFSSLSPHRAGTSGIMVFDLLASENKKDLLVGYFCDVGANGRNGAMCLFRDEKEYRTKLDELADAMPAI
jgi:predicted small secreted protein